MNIRIFQSYDDLSFNTAEFISDYIRQNPECLLCFAAGDTPAGTFQYLVDFAREGKVDFRNSTFVGLDEWVGMDVKDEGSCKHFMYTRLFNPLGIESSRIVFFDACAENLQEECRRVDQFIFNRGGIDLMLVGVGMNGHIGLNEPGTSPNLYSHVVELDLITKQVGQKYFSQYTQLEKGITLGMKHLMEAKCVVLIASDTKKASVIQKVLTGEITNEVPASLVRLHRNCHVFLDKEAASLLKGI